LQSCLNARGARSSQREAELLNYDTNEMSDEKEKLAVEAVECNFLLPHLLKNKS
jgi:hypothetical protein